MSKLIEALKVTLDNLGNTERTKPDVSQDKLDAVAHEFNISSFGRNYFNKRYDKAKEALLTTLGPVVKETLNDALKKVKKTQATETLMLGDAANHSVGARIVIGASFLDEIGMREELNTIIGEHNTELLFKKYKQQRDPTVTYLVTDK